MTDEPASLPNVEAEVPVFDLAGVLERMMGDQELVWMVIEAFLDDGPGQIQELEGFLRSRDLDGTRRQAHSIKGAAATVGAERLRKMAFAMEQAADAGNLEPVEAAMVEMQVHFHTYEAAIKGKGRSLDGPAQDPRL
jgi:HPt (histidine-containing phosphotransfer) domain-containing protein